MKILRTVFFFWVPVILWMFFIYTVSADSNPYRAIPNARQAAAVKPSLRTSTATPPVTASPGDSLSQETPSVLQPTAVKPTANAGKEALPTSGLRPELEALGRLAHAIEYALLSFLLARAITHPSASPLSISGEPDGKLSSSTVTSQYRYGEGRRGLFLVLAFFFAFAFGLSDEIHQLNVAGRTFQNVDLILDALGAAGGVLIFAKLRSNPIFAK